MKTALLYARIQFLRVFRDPITLIVLFSIPLILLLVFGSFTTRDTDDISLKVAVINNSNEEFAAQFKRNIDQVKVLNQPETTASLNGAKELMKSGQIDGIIELPKEFLDLQESSNSDKESTVLLLGPGPNNTLGMIPGNVQLSDGINMTDITKPGFQAMVKN